MAYISYYRTNEERTDDSIISSVGKIVSIRNKRMSSIAGLLILTAATFNIISLVGAFTQILDIKELLHITWVISPFPYFILDVGFGGNIVIASIIAIVFVLGILLSIIGSVFSLRRRAWGLALTGSIGALICIPFLGIVAVILIVMSKNQFVGQQRQR